jgi:signal transduction histidine kinase
VDGSIAPFLVTAGASGVAIASLLWALRVTDGARGVIARWKEEVASRELMLARLNSVLGAHPGVVLIWEDAAAQGDPGAGDWGQPKAFGSTLALGGLLRFSDRASSDDPAVRILQGLAAFEGKDITGQPARLAPALQQLRREGAPFSMTIATGDGVHVEVDGRTAGARVIVWLVDSTVKGMEQGITQGRLPPASVRVMARDPSFFLEILQDAPFLAWRVTDGGALEWANDTYIKAFDGKTHDQAVQRNLQIDQATVDQARRVMAGGQAITEMRTIVIDGKRRAFEVLIAPVLGGAAGMAFDVTEREEARDNFVRHVSAHDETLNHLSEGVAVFGADKRLIFHNKAFADMWRLDPSFLLDRPSHAQWLDELKTKRMLPMHGNYAEWRAGELALYQEVAELPEDPWNLQDGRMLRVARQRHPMGGLLLIFSDITNEQTLRGQYNNLVKVQQAALDRLHEGVAVFAANGRMRLANSAFNAMWGIEPDALPENADFEAFMALAMPLYHETSVWRDLKARLTDPSPSARREDRGEMRRSDGTVVTWLTRPLPDGATLIAFLDITAAKRVETALRDQAEALAAADRLKTEFVQNVSVQLRDPLQTITGYSEMLATRIAGPLNDRQQDQVNNVLSAATHLSKLVDNVLDLAMIEAGEVALELSDVNIHAALQEAAASAATNARDTEIPVRISCDPRIGAIRADEKRIRQILFNLVSNALRNSQRGDEITIGAERQDGMVRLWVQDTGIGMEYEAQAVAFDTFSSADKHGAGLGLALVRSFAELHEGWVALRSGPGEGTTVSVHLPVSGTMSIAAE